MAFYSLDEINKIGAQYNFLLGGRGCGKTYAVIKQAIENYFATGEQFAYVRRYKESIGPTKTRTLIDPHKELIMKLSEGRYNHVKIWKQCFWLEYVDPESGRVVEKNPEPMGVLVSLNTQDNDKGQDLGFMRYIIFDEVIARNGYLKDEWSIFQNCISSLVRNRPGTTIYMLANPISKFCLYFDELGIDFNAAQQGKIYVIKYDEEGKMKCAFEYIGDNLEGCSTVADEYFGFKNEKARSITEGIWELENVKHLDSGIYKVSTKKRTIYLEFTGKYFACDIMYYNEVYYEFWRPATKIPEKEYYLTLERPLDKYGIVGCYKNHPIYKLINDIFVTGRVFYATNTVGDYISGFRAAVRQMKV